MAKKKAAKRGRPKVSSPRESVTLRLKPEQLEQLNKMAEDQGVNRSSLIQLAVSRYLKEEQK